MRTGPVLLLLLTTTFTTLAQTVRLTDWRTISSMQTATDADVDHEGTLWVSTTGGVFSRTTSGMVTEYRNVNELQTLDARSLLCDRTSRTVYVGGGDGSLDIRESGGSWENIKDIRRASQYPKRGVNAMFDGGDVLFIATDFGFVTFDKTRRVFIETVDRIGTLQEKTRANGIVLYHDSVWVATDSGVAVAPLNVPTLRPPSIWRILDTTNGLSTVKIKHIATNGTQLAVASDYEGLVWTGTAFEVRIGMPEPMTSLDFDGDLLTASSVSAVRSTQGPMAIPWGGPLNGHRVVSIHDTSVIVGFLIERAVRLWNGTELTPVVVNTPISNQFARMTIDEDDGFWVATDVDPPRTGQGVSYFDGLQWHNFNRTTRPEFTSNACFRINALENGKVMIGTWGGGLMEAAHVGDSIVLTAYRPVNSAIKGVQVDSNYAVVGDAALDRSGKVWIVNEQTVSQLLVSVDATGATQGFANCVDARNNMFRPIAVDLAGNKWVGSSDGGGALLAFNEKGTLDRADDVCQVIRSSNTQLPDNVITVLRTDRTGQLWIGTAKGVAVISSPTGVSNTSLPFVRRISALTSVYVNDLYVDALNNKWVATTGGVFVLNADGTEVLATITNTTAPLLDNNVRSIAVSKKTGLAYFGTSAGCSVARSSSIQPETVFALSFRPQPFSLAVDRELTIDGLAADADIRIMTPGGVQVATMKAQGRQAIWNGKDTEGRDVPPGVYLVHSTSSTSKESAVGKIMVKR
jgi:ligand-binding sensor domain-containing protein